MAYVDIKDFITGDVYTAKVLDSKPVNDEESLLSVRFSCNGETFTIALLEVANGNFLSTEDWQGEQPHDIEEVDSFSWVDVTVDKERLY